ncbi:hypothetical protein KKJ04_21730, partial [Xenorhabdus bovienii]|nr:hypothetical protein [Xenorhabdus bovienii]
MNTVSLGHTICPHCLRDNAVLKAVGETHQSLISTRAVSFKCGSCNGITVAEIFSQNQLIDEIGLLEFAKRRNQDLILDGRGTGSEWGMVRNIYPKIKIPSAPANVPPRCAKFFIEARENLQRGNCETSVTLSRKVIDLATKELGVAENITTNNLSARIDKLRDL